MKILVVGGGGREHAIVKKLKESPRVSEVHSLPGNGGISDDAVCAAIEACDFGSIISYAKNKLIDFAVVAPDNPLVLGLTDELEKAGIPCFGPSKRAAAIEGSKVFSKELMKKYGIPTAAHEVFNDPDKALLYAQKSEFPLVIKADGLALGKGVIIAENYDEARAAIRSIMEDKIFGESGSSIVIEKFLKGPEASVLCFTDGTHIAPMVSSMDHKRAGDGDTGANTGGMGAIAPNPYYTAEIEKRCMSEIFLPTINAMKAEGRLFKGCLYFGLMLCDDGPYVIEYNCRFGDPETQAVLPLLETDLLSVMEACRNENLSEISVSWKPGFTCCLMLTSKGYPGKYEKGFSVSGLDDPVFISDDICVYHSGTAKNADGETVTAGGRVLGISAVSDSLSGAVLAAYEAALKISFEGMSYRRDIGKKAISFLD